MWGVGGVWGVLFCGWGRLCGGGGGGLVGPRKKFHLNGERTKSLNTQKKHGPGVVSKTNAMKAGGGEEEKTRETNTRGFIGRWMRKETGQMGGGSFGRDGKKERAQER